MCRSGGSGGRRPLSHHAAGGVCVTPGGQEVGVLFSDVPLVGHESLQGVIIFLVTTPEDHLSLWRSGGGPPWGLSFLLSGFEVILGAWCLLWGLHPCLCRSR